MHALCNKLFRFMQIITRFLIFNINYIVIILDMARMIDLIIMAFKIIAREVDKNLMSP